MMREERTYLVKDEKAELEIETETQSKSEELYQRLLKITQKGNHAEVKRQKDGSLVVYEVKKSKIM